MDIYTKSTSFQLTELWFKWLGWLTVCAVLNVSSHILDSHLIGLVYWISISLVAYSIGSTSMELWIKLTKKHHSKLINVFLRTMIIINPILLAVVIYIITEMVKVRF